MSVRSVPAGRRSSTPDLIGARDRWESPTSAGGRRDVGTTGKRETGQRVAAGQRILVLEAMKMEVEITAHTEGVVERVHCSKGAMVTAGQNLATVRLDG